MHLKNTVFCVGSSGIKYEIISVILKEEAWPQLSVISPQKLAMFNLGHCASFAKDNSKSGNNCSLDCSIKFIQVQAVGLK